MKKVILFIVCFLSITNIYSQGVSINSGTHLVVNGAASIVVKDGSFTNNGTFNAGTGTVHMTGATTSANSTVGGTTTSDFNNLVIDKSSNGVELGNGISLSGNLTMTSGDLNLNSQNINLTNSASIVNETETNRIWGTSGQVVLSTNLNIPTNANPGNLGLDITSADNLGTVTIQRIHGAQTINGSQSIDRHYKIKYSNTGLSVNYQFHYLDAELNGVNETYLQTWNYQNAWQQRDADAANTSTNFLQVNGVSETDTLWALSTGKLRFSPKALLSGNYDASGLMNDNLRATGNIPTTEPFTGLGYTLVNCACDPTTQPVLDVTGNNAIVDWVLIELRDKTNRDNILQSVAALLQKDGDVVDVDGTSAINIPNLSTDSFFVAIKHRNHIGIITTDFQEITPLATAYDFTTNINQTLGGTNGIASTGDGYFAMFSGDVDRNGQVQTSDGSALILNIGSSGYLPGDLDLNGQVQNTDLNNHQIPNRGRGVQFNN